MPRQAKIDQIITRTPPRPGIPLRSAIEVPAPIGLRGVKTVVIHFGGVKHDVVRFTVSENFSESNSSAVSTRTYVQCCIRA